MGLRAKDTHRPPLTRRRIVETALRFVDTHGLEALSMHKLGAALGVRGMSLYSHVADKDALLDGIVEVMWEEVELGPEQEDDWPQTVRTFVRSLRGLVLRHPHAASLLLRRQVMPEPALRICDTVLRRLAAAGIPPARAAPLLRTMVSYGFGFALAELSFLPGPPDPGEDELGKFRRVSSLLPPDLDNELMRVALLMCGECNVADEFELGTELMIRGLQREPDRAAPE